MCNYKSKKNTIVRSVSSYEVAVSAGMPINKFGRMDQCPICRHNGHAGFVANPIDEHHKGEYYCFYSHHGGNVIDFVMTLYGYTYTEAVNWIIRTFNLYLPQQEELNDTERESVLKEQKMRNAFLILYEQGVKLYYKVMKEGQAENIAEASSYLDNVIAMIEKID